MKFSIITASFNGGRYLRDCIESVKNQTGAGWEHIVADACSTDETHAILREYPHLQWNAEPDCGMSDGINKGFLQATGDWVMWLNTDDFLLPGTLAKVAALIEQHPEADVVYGGWHFTDEEGRTTRTIKLFPFDRLMNIHLGPYIGSTACFFRKKTIIDEGFLLNVNFRINMDGEFYARLAQAGKRFVYMPEVLAGFRVHGQNLSVKNRYATGIDGALQQQKQIAEWVAIKRAYGITLFHRSLLDAIVDSTLWTYFKIKKIILKIAYGSYSLRKS